MNQEERNAYVPAARCRECGVITLQVSITFGLRRTNAEHEPGCSVPPGRLELAMEAKNLKDMARLLRPMSNAELDKIEAQLHDTETGTDQS